MSRGVALLVVLAAVCGSSACRQFAGIEDITPADAASTDAGDAGNCGCPGCTMLAKNLNTPLSLVLVGTDVYFLNYGPETGQGSLMRVSQSGGAPETVVKNLSRPLSILADATHLYWRAEDIHGKGTIEKRAIAGGSVVTLATGQGVPVVISNSLVNYGTNALLALTDSHVYWINYLAGFGPTNIMSIPVTGGTVGSFLLGLPGKLNSLYYLQPKALQTDGTSLFVVTNDGHFAGILKAPLAGGKPEVLIDNLVAPANLALSGSDVLFCDEGLSTMHGSLQSIPQSGGSSTTLLRGVLGPWGVVVDGGLAYCVVIGDGSGNGSIVQLDLNRGTSKPVISHASAPEAVVVDSTSIYWVDSNCGTVMKAPK